MKVTLVNYTPHALETLIFTKQTRLKMTAAAFEEVKAWPEEQKLAEWEYMRNTIQSSWEFVDYVFALEEVSRAFTHQLVRHRAGTSFAQQAQRLVDMSGFSFVAGPSVDSPERVEAYDGAMEDTDRNYRALVALGVRPQDARGVLPTNIHTNICFKANLRTLHDMGLKRLCVKSQGEFQDVFRSIRDQVVAVHPWTAPVVRVFCATYGVCCFPSFPTKDCPTKPNVFDPTTGRTYGGKHPEEHVGAVGPRSTLLDLIQATWEGNRAEAQPTAPKEPEAPPEGSLAPGDAADATAYALARATKPCAEPHSHPFFCGC